MPCGQKGRVGPVVHLAHGADGAGLDPLGDLRRGLAVPAAQNMWVAAPVSRAVWITSRASWKTLPSGLWTITCFPAFIAASATVACRWSGVMM